MRLTGYLLIVGLCLTLVGCRKDETLSGYGAAGQLWVLQSIDEQSFSPRATLEFPEPGRITGQAPCNRYTAAQTAPYPWFSATRIAATKRACPELDAESHYLNALASMTLSEVAGETLILSNDAGREMVFKAAQ